MNVNGPRFICEKYISISIIHDSHSSFEAFTYLLMIIEEIHKISQILEATQRQLIIFTRFLEVLILTFELKSLRPHCHYQHFFYFKIFEWS